ncbi:hypothetical protein HZS_64 [Henneguya salminicola]|nr:hypothetical protein HZS_64 [Henneguya salminicola]
MNSFSEMQKVFVNKKKKMEHLRKYKISELIVNNSYFLKETLLQELIKNTGNKKGNNTPLFKGEKNNNLFQTCLETDTVECERYYSAKNCGHAFFLTNVMFNDLFKMNFSIYNGIIEYLTTNFFNSITSSFYQLDKLKNIKYQIENKIHIEGVLKNMVEESQLKFDAMDSTGKNMLNIIVPKLKADIPNKISSILNMVNEQLLNKIKTLSGNSEKGTLYPMVCDFNLLFFIKFNFFLFDYF